MSRRKVGMTPNQHGPYASGYTHGTMANTKGCQTVRWSQSHQSWSKFGLRAEIRPYEVGIASNRVSARHGEYVLGFCTHCPSSQESRWYPKVRVRGNKVKLVIRAKS